MIIYIYIYYIWWYNKVFLDISRFPTFLLRFFVDLCNEQQGPLVQLDWDESDEIPWFDVKIPILDGQRSYKSPFLMVKRWLNDG